ncbi:MAG: ABC-2 transporter permease [Bifidobacteriaceae bacterium]|nr:ABC-2 transporter permease [Bifidobacteriaceae bacterium]MCI1978109.1 ABC-2 transporter permease [Bifidobacteriaceae bacterium]
MKSALLQVRLDAIRTYYPLKAMLINVVTQLVVAAFLLRNIKSEGSAGWICSIFICLMCAMMCISPALSESLDNHQKINGFIPISRFHQVVGRYIFLLSVCLMGLMSMGLSYLLTLIMQKGWGSVASTAMLIVGVILFIGGILIPLFYKIDISKAGAAMSVVMFAVILAPFLLTALPIDWSIIIQRIGAWCLVNGTLVKLILAAGLAIELVASFLTSLHILDHREY